MSESNPDGTAERSHHRQGRPRSLDGVTLASGIAALCGVWIVVTPLVFGSSGDAELINNLGVGLVLALVAGYNWYRLYSGHRSSVGAIALVLLLGVWMLVFPFALDLQGAVFWSDVAAGSLVSVAGLYAAYRGKGLAVGRTRRA